MYTREEVAAWFTKLEGEDPIKASKFKRLHDAAREYATAAQELLPDRHEAVIAMDRIQESVHWGNTAIAREGSDTGVDYVIPKQQPNLERM